MIEAIRHAQSARDWSRAARLLLDNRIGLILDGRLAAVRELLDAFPASVRADDPELAITSASVLLRDGSFDEGDAYIASAERHAQEVAEDRKWLFALHLASVRLAIAGQRGDLRSALQAMRSLRRRFQASGRPVTPTRSEPWR